jgi:hypothetical protein
MKRTKAAKAGGPPHLVPLAPQAVGILRDLHPLTGHVRYVFPAPTTGARCMSENTVRSALRRLGYGNDDTTAHGFRAMARTMIAERLGVAADVIEAQLAHAVPDVLDRAYNRTQFVEQRRDTMINWMDGLDRLRAGAQVISIKARVAQWCMCLQIGLARNLARKTTSAATCWKLRGAATKLRFQRCADWSLSTCEQWRNRAAESLT